MNKQAKKILYGTLYFLIFAGLILGVYQLTTRSAPTCFDNIQNQREKGVDCGGPCDITCEEKNLSSVQVHGEPQLLTLSSGEVSVLAEVINNNENFNSRFAYRVKVYNRVNDLVESRAGVGVSYPETPFILNENFSLPGRSLGRAEVEIIENEWLKNEGGFRPDIEAENVTFDANEVSATFEGTIFSDATQPVKKVKVIVVVRDRGNNDIFASQTILENIQPQNSYDFEIGVPTNQKILNNVDLSNTRAYVSILDAK